MTFLIPAGAASDPAGAEGSANVLADWILRGAGSRDSRALTSYLDDLGVQRGCSADTVFFRFGASMLGRKLQTVLPVYADIVRSPHLPEDGFGPSVDLALQQLESVEDEPAQKLHILLRQQHYDYPFGRSGLGDKEQLEHLTAEQLRCDFKQRFSPKGAILSIAGMFDWPALRDAVEAHFGLWESKTPPAIPSQPAPRGVKHVKQETNQVQIGLAFDTVPEKEPDSLFVQAALSVLSGGMGARLFTEIREKQGLCYSVHAGYHSFRDRAAVFGYSGTAPDRAQRTLDSFLAELKRLQGGVTSEELDRALIGMKSRIIMQGESANARAGAMAYDYYHRGRPRTLDEVRALIESITLEKVNGYLADHPVAGLTVVTVGPEELTVHRL